MKKITLIALAFAALFTVQACKSQTTKAPEGISKGQIDSVSMAIGVYFAEMIKGSNLDEVNYSVIFNTMKKIRDGKEVSINSMQGGDIINSYMMKKQTLIADQNLKKGEEFLAKNKTKDGVIELPSGLQYKILEEGTGEQPTSPTDIVTVHYKGTLINGTQFDSSYDRDEPATFPLNGVIAGWTEGFQYLKEGTKAILYIPSDLAYGPQQRSAEITPNSTLIFEVELISVTKAEAQDE
ncbi:MAG: FKBP-type peptidyl-prolyl cis-trans isomerase [Bacteroidales bacterium]|nr:FKBP-type peptidyl-prolyl cis-trans isomerase [Bacteroidales bacterium]